MAYTLKELRDKKDADLREIAKATEHEALKGYAQLSKGHLLRALCTALEIETHGHFDGVSVDKGATKKQIRELKTARDAALAAHEHDKLKRVRREIRGLKRTLRHATV